MWAAVPWWRLSGAAVVCGAIAGGLFWWSNVAHGRKGPVFLTAVAAIFASVAIGCLLLLVWHGTARLRGRTPS